MNQSSKYSWSSTSEEAQGVWLETTNSIVLFLYQESNSMIKFALAKGKRIPVSIIHVLGQFEEWMARREGSTMEGEELEKCLAALNRVHAQLSDIVKPIRPEICHLLASEAGRRNFWRFLGVIPIARVMAGLAIFSLLVMLACTFWGWYEGLPLQILNPGGSTQIGSLVFLVASASMGGAFSLLFIVNRELVEGAYEPIGDSSYLSTWVLGIVVGLSLSEWIITRVEVPGQSLVIFHFLPVWLGGFGATLVYTLFDLVLRVSGFVYGKKKTRKLSGKERKAWINRLREENILVASRLGRLKNQIQSPDPPAEVHLEIDALVEHLLKPYPHGFPEDEASFHSQFH